MVAQIVDTIERIDEDRRSVQWSGPEYRLSDLEDARKALYNKASARLGDSWRVLDSTHGARSGAPRFDRCSFGEVSVVKSDISSVQLKLPFEAIMTIE